jgi:hypothetical protein
MSTAYWRGYGSVAGTWCKFGGFASLEGRAHLCISSSLEPTIWILLYKIVLHLSFMLGMFHPPLSSVFRGLISGS